VEVVHVDDICSKTVKRAIWIRKLPLSPLGRVCGCRPRPV
jgi:hypothetical protein